MNRRKIKIKSVQLIGKRPQTIIVDTDKGRGSFYIYPTNEDSGKEPRVSVGDDDSKYFYGGDMESAADAFLESINESNLNEGVELNEIKNDIDSLKRSINSSGQLEVNGISYIFDELVQQLKIMDERISKLERGPAVWPDGR